MTPIRFTPPSANISVALAAIAVFAVLSVSAADPPETTTPLPIGEAPSALSQFVGGLRVDVLPPRAIDRRGGGRGRRHRPG